MDRIKALLASCLKDYKSEVLNCYCKLVREDLTSVECSPGELFNAVVSCINDAEAPTTRLSSNVSAMMKAILEVFGKYLLADNVCCQISIQQLEECLSQVGLQVLEALYNKKGEKLRMELQKQFEASERKLIFEILRAQERERAKLAAEIHDTIIQEIAGVLVRIRVLSELLRNSDKALCQELQEAERLARTAITKCRVFGSDMESFWLEEAGLVPVLESYLRDIETRYNIKINFKAEVKNELPRTIRVNVLRIIQEALRNVIKHSEATAAEVRLSVNGGSLHIEVKDNGVGFDVSALDISGHEAFGLVSIQQRAKWLGGEAKVDSCKGGGTTVQVTIPIHSDSLSVEARSPGRSSVWIRSA